MFKRLFRNFRIAKNIGLEDYLMCMMLTRIDNKLEDR